MSVISSMMNNALSGALAYQSAINVTSTNIANAGSDGYSRQVVYLKEDLLGVDASTVKRVYDQYIAGLANEANETYGQLESESKYVQSLEAMFNDLEGYGLSDSLDEFWNAWIDLADDADDDAARAALAGAAEDLADTFNLLDGQLTDTQAEVEAELDNTVAAINDLTADIAELNAQITKAESLGQDTGTLEDRMATYISDLSSLVDINTYQNSDGETCITLEDGGYSLVEGSKSWNLERFTNTAADQVELVWNDGGGGTVNLGADMDGGTLGGLMTVRNETLPEAFDALDELAGEIIGQVNALHQAGYDLTGAAGVAFFTGTDAGDMTVNQSILDDPALIAASSSAAGSPGDAGNAAAVAELQSALTMNGGTATFSEFYNSFISQLGDLSQSLQDRLSEQEEWVGYYDTYLESVSGVSTDEETARLVEYQSAYEAALKVIGVMEEMMRIVIEM